MTCVRDAARVSRISARVGMIPLLEASGKLGGRTRCARTKPRPGVVVASRPDSGFFYLAQFSRWTVAAGGGVARGGLGGNGQGRTGTVARLWLDALLYGRAGMSYQILADIRGPTSWADGGRSGQRAYTPSRRAQQAAPLRHSRQAGGRSRQRPYRMVSSTW